MTEPRKHKPESRPVIGWREWVGLPDLDVPTIKAKVDTGARTSSLHAFDLEEFTRRGTPMVRFTVQPEQRSRRHAVVVEARVHDWRNVRPSSGHAEMRPVIHTTVDLLGRQWTIELTLTSRDSRGFRMLLGRQAIRDRFLVDPGKSFLNGRRARGSRRLSRQSPGALARKKAPSHHDTKS
jgi:hypothetical protein